MIRNALVKINTVIIDAVTKIVQKVDDWFVKSATGPTVWQRLGWEKKTNREVHLNFTLFHFLYAALVQSTTLLILINLFD